MLQTVDTRCGISNGCASSAGPKKSCRSGVERPAEVLPKSGSARVLMEQTPPIYPGREQEGTLGITSWDCDFSGVDEEDRNITE